MVRTVYGFRGSTRKPIANLNAIYMPIVSSQPHVRFWGQADIRGIRSTAYVAIDPKRT